MIKNKYLLFFIILLVFLFYNNVASAAEITFCNKGSVGDYVVCLFDWGVKAAGAIALISFVIGAVGLLASFGSAEAESNAKDRMRGAILGLILITCSWLILHTINPAFENLTLTKIEPAPSSPVYRWPGVYFYTEPDCKGAYEGPYVSSHDSFILGAIKSFDIVNDPKNNINLVVVAHGSPNLSKGGTCSIPIISEGCHSTNIPVPMFAADVSLINPDAKTSGTGATFYSKPFGEVASARAGFYDLLSKNPGYNGFIMEFASDMCFDYTNITAPDEYKYRCVNPQCGGNPQHKGDNKGCSDNACETFADAAQNVNCQGALAVKGGYLVAIYSPDPQDENVLYCQTFTKNTDNLKSQPFLAAGTKRLTFVYVIATK